MADDELRCTHRNKAGKRCRTRVPLGSALQWATDPDGEVDRLCPVHSQQRLSGDPPKRRLKKPKRKVPLET